MLALRQAVLRTHLGSLLRVSQSWNQVVGQLGYNYEALGIICFQSHSDNWQNLVPWDCRTEVSIFFLVVSLGLLSPSKDWSHFLIHAPLNLQSQKRHIESFSYFKFSLTLLSATSFWFFFFFLLLKAHVVIFSPPNK